MSARDISESERLLPYITQEINNIKSKTFVIPSCVISPVLIMGHSTLVKNSDAVEGCIIKESQLLKSIKIYFSIQNI